MTTKNARVSPVLIAAAAGLLFAVLYVGLEILTGKREATDSISVWHFPLTWLLAGLLFFLVHYTGRTARAGKVREHVLSFALSVAGAALLTFVGLWPMVVNLLLCFGGSGCKAGRIILKPSSAPKDYIS